MSDESATSRRRFLKHAAAAAWASPLILTLATPSASAQPNDCGVVTYDDGMFFCQMTYPCNTGYACVARFPGEIGTACTCA